MSPTPPVRRRSPVLLPTTPLETEIRDGWEVVLEYEGEGDGPWLVDLSHRARWDFQDAAIDEHRPYGLEVPREWGAVGWGGGLLINRMNRTQASIWHVGPDPAPEMPDVVSYTDTTDAHCGLAVIGEAAPAAIEALTSLDLFPPDLAGPRLVQGPILGVPAQVVAFPRDAALFTIARGYGQTFVETVLESARHVGLRPAGEAVLTIRQTPGTLSEGSA